MLKSVKLSLFHFCDRRKENAILIQNWMVSLCCTNQEILRFFVRGLPFGRPSSFLQGPASFSNLADLMIDFGRKRFSKSFSWLLYLRVHLAGR